MSSRPSPSSLRLLTAAATVAALHGCGAGASRGRLASEGPAPAGRAGGSVALRDPGDLYLAGDFERSREAFRRLSSPGETSLEGACVLYGLARSEYVLGRIAEARSVTERLLELLDGLEGREGSVDAADLRAYALVLLSDVALAQKRPAESIALLDRLRAEGLEGRAGHAPEILFRRAAALEAVGRRRSAQRAFRRLALVWPEGPLAAESLSRAGNIGRPVYEARAGVFETKPSAEARARALEALGFSARVEVEAAGAGRRFVVSLGRFFRRRDAETAKAQAESEGFGSDISVRMGP